MGRRIISLMGPAMIPNRHHAMLLMWALLLLQVRYFTMIYIISQKQCNLLWFFLKEKHFDIVVYILGHDRHNFTFWCILFSRFTKTNV